ncbi:hypothetical protein EMIHUDRAFT_233340 [Emiliania huxleyi CCMP1516]|uniref:Uncharacterized protein n=2 Tax=Emiliania huxleyi TaxID=2903 RepID=A0A0D3K2F8_EMIH1|nr:hypothetical protein EMIHUDRAFT_233340 [Emiliania huxleyi CCMP1516]EOD29943.1 hypothetical protein EMIHUDRAFT_233340 [Emiliania huxleyi CCMP1516]|eukprot:XP_005782372.1 hypothetical protein EMIHUDRAFT_233340 [Emiliania huxleyi CCMP1516]
MLPPFFAVLGACERFCAPKTNPWDTKCEWDKCAPWGCWQMDGALHYTMPFSSPPLLLQPPPPSDGFTTSPAVSNSRATRGHAHLTSPPPHSQHGGVVSLANDVEGAKLAFAGCASAAAGEQGMCAPRAAAPAGSYEPPSRGSLQESGSIR